MPERLKTQVMEGYIPGYNEVKSLADVELEELCQAADEIRKQFCLNDFDLCSVVRANSSLFSETEDNSRLASCYGQKKEIVYSLWDVVDIVKKAQYNFAMGAMRIAIVTEGKTMPKDDMPVLCQSYRSISKQSGIRLCAAHGFLTPQQFAKLKEAGVTRYHVNLRSARSFYQRSCCKKSYDAKIKTIKNAQKSGLSVCVGIVLGLGEDFSERVELAISLRELGIKSILMSIYKLSENELTRAIAVFRFVLPDATIRIDHCWKLLVQTGEKLFTAGANAAIAGTRIENDIDIFEKLGFRVKTI